MLSFGMLLRIKFFKSFWKFVNTNTWNYRNWEFINLGTSFQGDLVVFSNSFWFFFLLQSHKHTLYLLPIRKICDMFQIKTICRNIYMSAEIYIWVPNSNNYRWTIEQLNLDFVNELMHTYKIFFFLPSSENGDFFVMIFSLPYSSSCFIT